MGIKSLAKEVGKEVAIQTLTGLLIADEKVVVPMDMVAIPAYQAYLLKEQPSFSIYIKEGEVLTQVMPTDAMQSTEIVESNTATNTATKKRKKSKYHTAYGKAFKELEPKYKLKSGKWAKNGFKRCAAAARKQAKGQVKK